MVNLNQTEDQPEDRVAIIGGFVGDFLNIGMSNTVLVYNKQNMARTGPPLIRPRAGHACTIFRHSSNALHQIYIFSHK